MKPAYFEITVDVLDGHDGLDLAKRRLLADNKENGPRKSLNCAQIWWHGDDRPLTVKGRVYTGEAAVLMAKAVREATILQNEQESKEEHSQ